MLFVESLLEYNAFWCFTNHRARYFERSGSSRYIDKLSFASGINVSEPTNSSMVIPKNFANPTAVDNLQSEELPYNMFFNVENGTPALSAISGKVNYHCNCLNYLLCYLHSLHVFVKTLVCRICYFSSCSLSSFCVFCMIRYELSC